MIVGYAFVVADLLHFGHINFLRQCKTYCDYLIVGVYVDELVRTYKRSPIIPYEERKELIKELRLVDKVIPVFDRDCTPALQQLREDGWYIQFVFHGDDWSVNDPDLVKTRSYIESVGGKLVQPKYYDKRTTTGTIKEIVKRYLNGEQLWK